MNAAQRRLVELLGLVEHARLHALVGQRDPVGDGIGDVELVEAPAQFALRIDRSDDAVGARAARELATSRRPAAAA